MLSRQVTVPVPPHGLLKSMTVADAVNLAQKANQSAMADYAVHVAEKIINVAPKYAPIYFVMASALLRTGNKTDARQRVLQGLEKAAGDAESHVHAGQLLSDMYENELSFELFEKAYKLDPHNPKVLVFYAAMLEKRNREGDAVVCLEKAIKKAPMYAGAYLALSLIKPDKMTPALCNMLHSYADKANDAQSKAQFLFAAARGHASRGEIAEEFAALERGNGFLRRSSLWRFETDVNDWQAIKSLFSLSLLTECAAKLNENGIANSVDEIVPIVFATLPRSGTTLAEQIFSSHPLVCAAGESNLFQGSLLDVSQQLFGDRHYWRHITADNFLNFIVAYRQRVRSLMQEQKLQKKYVTDKSIGNYLVAGIIIAAFPKAKIIHCVRDPLDVTLSCFQNYFQDGLAYTCDLRDMAKVCKLFTEVMSHWKDIFHERIRILNYESLVRDPESTLKPLYEFADLEWDPDCLNFYQKGNVVHTASIKQVQQPINTKGLARWKKYELYLQPAIDELRN